MADHSNFVTLAQRLIAKHGRIVSIAKLDASSADSSKPWTGPAAPVLTEQVDDVHAVFLPASGGGFGSVVKDEDLLKRVEQVALVAPHEVDLRNMNVFMDRVNYKIEWVQVLEPADQVCLYVFGVKR